MRRVGSHVRRNVIAYLALFVALGGTSYAATGRLLPRNSVGTRQVVDHSLLKADFKAGQLPRGAVGPRGAAGVQGSRGDPGAQGSQGAPGAAGAQGPQGAAGMQGAKGEVGATGGVGATGPAGPPVGRAPFALTTIDSGGDVGQFTSVTVGTDGFGLISYLDVTNADLKVAHCSNLACTAATTRTLDSSGIGNANPGDYTSVTIGTDGFGLIAYRDEANAALKVAHCSNLACTAATTTTLDSTGSVGLYASLTLGADGFGLISYKDGTNGALKVAHCSNLACTDATTSTIDSAADGDVGEFTSATVGTDGFGLISYEDLANSALKVAHCSNTVCTAATTSTIDSGGGEVKFTSVTVGTDGLGLISYEAVTEENHDLKVAHCSNTVCTAATTTSPAFSFVQSYTSVAVGTDGLGLISYYAGGLEVAHCSNLACTAATTSTLDSTGNVGLYTSLTVGADGLGLISYYDNTTGDLKVAHCALTGCPAYAHSR